MWPAIVLDESFVSIRRGLNKISGEKSVLVQFFGTHDFARYLVSTISISKTPNYFQNILFQV